ncbi:MAG: phenylalanine--tRNA ligase subunit beta [Gammaproteobacteria bacterium]
MKISEKWLREWVNPACDLTTLVNTLTMAGLEVENSSPAAKRIDKVVVAEVIDLQPHPNADKLRVCQVNAGKEILQIVCGAKNVFKGAKVPAALIGADLGNDFVIKASQLRGVDSFGMLCSASELGLAETSEGLLILPADAPVGESLQSYLQLDDHTLEISLTPNRADCLSIAGLARDVAAITKTAMTPVNSKTIQPVIDTVVSVKLMQPEACPLYAGRVIKNINSAADTPVWMKEKLRRCGIRSIHPVVDVTNYVMLELGQPMHAFDCSKLNGDIQVRMSKAGETLTLLDGKTATLDERTLVIADDNKALAIAGIMGGIDSAVSESTTDIFLESAFFTPTIIAGRARVYGLHTDSSHRFERGVDPALPSKAIERATELLLDIVGGQAGSVVVTSEKKYIPENKPIKLRLARINHLLGLQITADWVEKHLPLLGFQLTKQSEPDSWMVSIPTYRFDVTLEADLIEEVARLFGYDNVPYTMPTALLAAHAKSESQLSLRQIKQILAARDYYEAVTYSFVDPKVQELFDPATKPYTLANPISPELSAMRTSIWQSLMTAYCQNEARQSLRVRLFETGLCFEPTENGLEQKPMLAGLSAGLAYAEQWGAANRSVDFFDIKKDVEALLALRHDREPVEFIPTNIPALHPGRAAIITVGKQKIGYIGEIHPRIMAALGLRQPVYLFEFYLNQLTTAFLPQFATLSKYPSVRRDIAIVVDQSVPVGELKQVFYDICGELLVDWQLFDVYQGKGIMDNKRSLAFGFTLQHHARTLTDEEVANYMDSLVTELNGRFGAILRE